MSCNWVFLSKCLFIHLPSNLSLDNWTSKASFVDHSVCLFPSHKTSCRPQTGIKGSMSYACTHMQYLLSSFSSWEQIVAKAIDGQRYPWPAWVGCSWSWRGSRTAAPKGSLVYAFRNMGKFSPPPPSPPSLPSNPSFETQIPVSRLNPSLETLIPVLRPKF